jgi:uncharacterized membrane protein YoaK (UPF0700 family)
LGLAFVGGYGDAAGFVLAKTFTGHVTGNLVLEAIAATAHDWRAMVGHLSAIVTFLIGVVLSVLILRPLIVILGKVSAKEEISTVVVAARACGNVKNLSLLTGYTGGRQASCGHE